MRSANRIACHTTSVASTTEKNRYTQNPASSDRHAKVPGTTLTKR
jgi:hypothetical protein